VAISIWRGGVGPVGSEHVYVWPGLFVTKPQVVIRELLTLTDACTQNTFLGLRITITPHQTTVLLLYYNMLLECYIIFIFYVVNFSKSNDLINIYLINLKIKIQ